MPNSHVIMLKSRKQEAQWRCWYIKLLKQEFGYFEGVKTGAPNENIVQNQ